MSHSQLERSDACTNGGDPGRIHNPESKEGEQGSSDLEDGSQEFHRIKKLVVNGNSRIAPTTFRLTNKFISWTFSALCVGSGLHLPRSSLPKPLCVLAGETGTSWWRHLWMTATLGLNWEGKWL